MRARLNASAITSKQKKDAIRQLVNEELKKGQKDNTRRIMKMFCVSLNEEFGFGHDRLMRLVGKVVAMIHEHSDDEIFWAKVDRLLNQIGMGFEDEEDENL